MTQKRNKNTEFCKSMADLISKNHHGTVTLPDTSNKEGSSSVNETTSSLSPDAQSREVCVPVHITNLPAEIFQLILKNLSFDNISKLRLVS